MKRNERGSAVAVLAAVALAAFALAGCGGPRQAPQEIVRRVSVARVERSTIAVSLEYPAKIRPRKEIVVSAKVSGRVATVRADVGQKVRRGEVLFTLESRDFDAQTRQARAALESARANLTRTSDSSLSSQLIQAQGAVKQAQVQYDDAKDVYERTRKLFDDGTASRQQLDGVKARFDSAAIALDTAKQNLSLIQDKGGPQSTGVASTQVDQAQANLDLAQSQLDNTRVTSPISGVVSVRNIDPGELVSSAVPAFVIIDVSTVSAEASVEEGMVDKIHMGQRVPLAVDAAGDLKLQGVVDSISPAADPRTQGYTVKVRIDNPGDAIKPGMFARVFFPVDRQANVLVIPNGALVTETGVDYVYAVVEADGSSLIKKIAVKPGIADAEKTAILSGVTEGMLVVTEGQSFLNDGAKVIVAR
jgi:HlyD family secretion protein